jgi:hypothetical protein
MRSFLVALLMALVLVTNTSAHAAALADVNRVVELVKRHPQKGDYQVVFVQKGKKYTIWYPSDRDAPDDLKVLSIWVRPVGTTGQATLMTFSDQQADGTVDFGIKGKRNEGAERQCLFVSERHTGEHFRSYWQGLYDQAIQAALASLARRK